jgi:glycosyltransferase involved in cell wall biosynthesis
MGRTVLEAMDFGVPVVVPDEGGSAELVQDGLTGLKYKANDPVSLAEVLDFASSQPELLENCARQAFDNLVIEHNAASYGQIINSFLLD